MKKLILSLFLAFTGMVNSQTLIAYDYIEAWSWGTGGAGWATGCGACGYYTNVFVSSTTSAALIGSGNGTSPIESGAYILTNITGLNSASMYMLKFRAGSYKLGAPSAGTAGNDAADYFDVQYSSNGGTTYITEMRVTGFSNALWNYNLNATASKTANGTMTTYAPTAGGDRTTTGDGYSLIQLNIPSGVTQLAFRIPTRSNSSGEEWWFDNFELWEISPLPVELISFEGSNTGQGNILVWKTATEHNSDYYLIERSTTGEFTEKSVIGQKVAVGNSTEEVTYTFIDNSFEQTLNYYRITQVDKDGHSKIYGPISINNNVEKKVIKTINTMGQEVQENVPNLIRGMYFEVYDDGTLRRVYKN